MHEIETEIEIKVYEIEILLQIQKHYKRALRTVSIGDLKAHMHASLFVCFTQLTGVIQTPVRLQPTNISNINLTSRSQANLISLDHCKSRYKSRHTINHFLLYACRYKLDAKCQKQEKV